MGMVVIMAHLVITLAFIAGYLITLWLGKDDSVFRVGLPVIIGYWFGAMGKDLITKKDNTKKDGE